jgi:hypothetical protein
MTAIVNPPLPRDPALLLAMVPAKNGAIRVETKSEGVVVWVPLNRPAWMTGVLSYVLPFRKEKGIALDVIGTEVFMACDGERKLETIIEEFAERHRLRFHEAKQSVVTFLRWLVERKVIVLALGPVEPV